MSRLAREKTITGNLDYAFSRHDLPQGTLNQVRAVVERVGTVAGAARVLGVPRRTLRGWLAGRNPRRPPNLPATIRQLRTADNDRWTAAYSGENTLAVRGKIRVSGDTRDRTIHPGRYIPTELIRSALDSWRAGDDDQCERILLSAIDRYYQPMEFKKIEAVWFE